MNWGQSIVLGFVLFAAFVFTLVYKMITSGNDLVKEKYYRTGSQINKELQLLESSKYLGQHIQVRPLPETPGSLEISFDSVARDVTGIARLTCLSSDKADQTIDLKPENAPHGKVQRITLLRPKHGTWLCELAGKTMGKPFLLRQQVFF